jgi:hypothetical protein
MEAALNLIAQNTAPGHHNRPGHDQHQQSTYKDFLDTKPPVFTQAAEPLQADEWLNTIEQKFCLHHYTDNQKAEFAAQQLQGEAGVWWTNYLATLPEGVRPTWDEFKEAFRGHHIPKGLMDIKMKEFLKLTQGTKTVTEYTHAFNHLSKYAPEYVNTQERRMGCFMRGLTLGLQDDLSLHTYATYNELVSAAIARENSHRPYKQDKKCKKPYSGGPSHQPRQAQMMHRPQYHPSFRQYRPPQQQKPQQNIPRPLPQQVNVSKGFQGGFKSPCYNCGKNRTLCP